MRKKMTKTDIAIRVLAVVSAVMVIISIITMTIYAYPQEVPDYATGSSSYKTLTPATCQKIYEAIAYQTMVNAPVLGYEYMGIPGYYPAFVTAAGDTTNVYTKIKVYFFKFTKSASNEGPRVSNIPEDIGEAGATLTFSQGVELYQAEYRAGSPYEPAISNYGQLAKLAIYASYTLNTNEQIICMYRGVSNGVNEYYNPISGSELEINVEYWEDAYNAILGLGGAGAEEIESAYDQGYAEGNQNGYSSGYTDGYDIGREAGYNEGWNIGYEDGYRNGSPLTLDVPSIITAIPEGAKTIINNALDFEIFGINVAGTLLAVLVVTIVAFIVKKVK